MSAALKNLPSVEKLTAALEKDLALPRPLLSGLIKSEVASWRERLLAGETAEKAEIESAIHSSASLFASSRLQPVINATGVLIHTNLGRSPLGKRAAEALSTIATGYSNLEFDLLTGERGKRAGYLERALAVLLETESATMVNNCAAALVLSLRHLTSAEKNEVIVSRGELVEIGGGFRIPDVLETSGAKLVEVGTTNKTHLRDYENAITEKTALILKVHRSNFYIDGFTSEPTTPELSELCQKNDVPLVEDLGSGSVMATDELAPIDHEPSPQECLRNGIDLVVFSGDKLLGGPQAGVIAGRADLVAGIKSEPFFRAVRCDKLILTVMQECIDDYLACKGQETPDIPTLTALSLPLEELQERTKKIMQALKNASISAELELIKATSRTGGGTMPKSEIPSVALKIKPTNQSVEKLARKLRTGSPALVGYTQDDALCFNLRTVFPHQDNQIVEALSSLIP